MGSSPGDGASDELSRKKKKEVPTLPRITGDLAKVLKVLSQRLGMEP